MVPVSSGVLFADALTCLAAHKRSIGRGFKGRFIQIFLGMKFFQNNIPSMYSGSFIATDALQALLDDIFSKLSRPAHACVLSVFEGNYLARTGLVGPTNVGPQNTWRNNFNLQKGVGCYAPAAELSSSTFLDQDRSQCRHLQAATPGDLGEARCSLCPTGAGYRGEGHRKWLRIDPGGNGYAAIDLQNVANFAPYVAPGGVRIPVFPLIVALYHDADPGLSLGNRSTVSLAEFAADFNFSAHEMSTYFDTSLSHPLNARLMQSAAWPAGSSPGGFTAGPPAPATAMPLLPALAQPVLGGTPTPPPNTNNGWDAEQYVAAALTTAGWTVHVVSRQQLGYDLFAQRGTQKRYVEVKSSLGSCSPSLTAREWQQASVRSNSYILAIVEHFNPVGQNVVYWVRDPANQCAATLQTTISHGITRASWAAAAIPLSNI